MKFAITRTISIRRIRPNTEVIAGKRNKRVKFLPITLLHIPYSYIFIYGRNYIA